MIYTSRQLKTEEGDTKKGTRGTEEHDTGEQEEQKTKGRRSERIKSAERKIRKDSNTPEENSHTAKKEERRRNQRAQRTELFVQYREP